MSRAVSESENESARVIVRVRARKTVTERECGGGTVGTSQYKELSQSEKVRTRWWHSGHVAPGGVELGESREEEEEENMSTEMIQKGFGH